MQEKTQLDKTEAGDETNADVNEAQIAVHWKEEEYYILPPNSLARRT
jgi:hypothetical protein